jgi:hypothetical protein
LKQGGLADIRQPDDTATKTHSILEHLADPSPRGEGLAVTVTIDQPSRSSRRAGIVRQWSVAATATTGDAWRRYLRTSMSPGAAPWPIFPPFRSTARWPAQLSDRLQLYSYPTPNGVKVAIALEEIGIPYEAHFVNIMENDT